MENIAGFALLWTNNKVNNLKTPRAEERFAQSAQRWPLSSPNITELRPRTHDLGRKLEFQRRKTGRILGWTKLLISSPIQVHAEATAAMARCWPLLWVLCGLAWLAPPGLPAFLQAHSRRHRLKVSKSALKDAGRDKDALSESLTSRSELGKDSEQLLRSFPQLEEQCGPYVISSQAPVLVASTRNLSNEVLAELRNGQVVQIQELSRLEQRLRGRLKEESDDPRWISLKNTQTGFRWACPKGALDEIEGKLQKLEAQVKEEKERTSDLPGEEESEMDTLVDLLYLKALFAQTAAGLPPLSSFERSRLGTWAMFGRGLDNWNAVAGKQGFEVPLVVVSGQLRREILRSLDRKRLTWTYCKLILCKGFGFQTYCLLRCTS